jgi:glycosyltransferase involved in cell wall biosynthesis
VNICIIGGIYGKSASFRKTAQYTPETLLEAGLRSQGHSVTTLSHYDIIPNRRFDVVHVHHLSWGAVRAACLDSGARFVFTPHDPRALCGRLSLLRQFATRFFMSRADAVIALSETEAAFQRRTYDLRHTMHAVIPNGIDLDTYRYVPHGAPARDEPWRLLYVGQLNQQKQVDVLLNALARSPANVELSLAFHVDTLRPELDKLAAGLGLASRVHFLGPQPPQALASLYQAAHLFVLPSAGEALPSVVTEAMACGTPVVATRVGGIAEQLGPYGFLVSPGDADELAGAIRQVLERYPHYAEQGEAMSRSTRGRFSVEQMVDRHIHLYEELLSAHSRSRRSMASRRAALAARHMVELPSRWRRPDV